IVVSARHHVVLADSEQTVVRNFSLLSRGFTDAVTPCCACICMLVDGNREPVHAQIFFPDLPDPRCWHGLRRYEGWSRHRDFDAGRIIPDASPVKLGNDTGARDGDAYRFGVGPADRRLEPTAGVRCCRTGP